MRSRWRYYLGSVPTLLWGIKPWPAILLRLLGRRTGATVAIELRAGGLRLLVRSLMDIWIVKETCIDREYERASVALRDGWTIVDIGAGLGDFAVDVCRRFPHSTVYAYEPFAESFELLQRNAALNGVTNLRARPVAVGDGAASQVLLYGGRQAPVRHSTASAARPDADAVPVAATTLDAIIRELPLERCDFLKMDCEGAEYEILFSASPATLAKIRRLCLEVHDGAGPHSRDDLRRFLEGRGFRVDIRENPAHRELALLHAEHTLP